MEINSGCIPSACAHKPAHLLVKLAAVLRAEAWPIEKERTCAPELGTPALGLALIYGRGLPGALQYVSEISLLTGPLLYLTSEILKSIL